MYLTIRPPGHLQKYIECFWFGDDLDLPQNPNTYHSIANSKIELLFFNKGIYASDANGKHEPVYRAGIYGQTTSFNHYFASAPRTTIFGITFRPLALLVFFKIPASEITNQRIEVESIFGHHGKEFSQRIYEAQTFEQKVTVSNNFFNSRVKELHLKYRGVEKMVMEIERSSITSVPILISQSCLSSRQFERSFKEITGFSAKTYIKLKRFENFIELITQSRMKTDKRLIDIAIELGYYDQSHLNRHFKEFTGMSPLEYLPNSILLKQ